MQSDTDSSGGAEIGYVAFRTPPLIPAEETKLLKFWEMVMDVFEWEARAMDDNSSANLFLLDSSAYTSLKKVSPESSIRRLRAQSFKTKGKISLPFSSALRNSSVSSNSDSSSSTSKAAAHLEDQQQEAFMQPFRAALWSAMKDDHPDEILYRFLRRQRWDENAAFDMLLDVLRWRSVERRVDDIMLSGEHGAYEKLMSAGDDKEREVAKGFLDLVFKGRAFIRGCDRQGRPIVYIRLRDHHRNAQPRESIHQFIIYLFELGRIIVGPSIDTVLFIWDFQGTDIGNNDPEAVMYIEHVLKHYYPMASGDIIVHRAPKYYESVWRVVKPLLHKEYSAEIHFTKTVQELERFVDRSQLIKEVGGDDDWEYAYVKPEPGENASMQNTTERRALLKRRDQEAAQFEALTRELIDANRDGHELADIRRARNDSIDRLRENFWKLDPLVRARCVYDRWGAFDDRKDAALNNGSWLQWREEREKKAIEEEEKERLTRPKSKGRSSK